MLVDDGQVIPETTCIIEHLQAHHPTERLDSRTASSAAGCGSSTASSTSCPGQHAAVGRTLRSGRRGRATNIGAELGRKNVRQAYDWLEANLPDEGWAAGDSFTLADCAAAPPSSTPTGSTRSATASKLKAYRARLLAHPQVPAQSRKHGRIAPLLPAWSAGPRLSEGRAFRSS